jgi:cytochrome c biogenesis protein CcmG, thiol:disulfide interchange protein DsbE
VVLALFVVLVQAKGGPKDFTTFPANKPAPIVEGPSLLDGKSFSLGAKRGRWMVVNFFAPTCDGCKEEHPALVDFWNRHRDTGDAGLVSVHWGTFGDSVESAKAFFDERGGDWPVVDDRNGQIGFDFSVVKLPETYIIDPNGFMVAKFAGAVAVGQIDALITKLETGP